MTAQPERIHVAACGDDGIMVDLSALPEANDAVQQLWLRLRATPPDFCLEPVAGVSTVWVALKPEHRSSAQREVQCQALRALAHADLDGTPVTGREVCLPVCYDASMAPDLPRVCERTGLDAAEVVRRHQAGVYRAQLMGFMPGFAYLSGLDTALSVPRLDAPRTAVPVGALGLAGEQCALYPSATPGGWNLIGRCPLQLFDPTRAEPALLQLGDRVRFEAISVAEFHTLWAQR